MFPAYNQLDSFQGPSICHDETHTTDVAFNIKVIYSWRESTPPLPLSCPPFLFTSILRSSSKPLPPQPHTIYWNPRYPPITVFFSIHFPPFGLADQQSHQRRHQSGRKRNQRKKKSINKAIKLAYYLPGPGITLLCTLGVRSI